MQKALLVIANLAFFVCFVVGTQMVSDHRGLV